ATVAAQAARAPQPAPPPATRPTPAAAPLPGAIGGVHKRSDLENPEYVRNLLQQRLGGNLVGVHSRQDLNDPEYLEKLLKNRLGGFGVVNRFANADEMQKFAQSRVGGLGIVHKRSDLEDPEYIKKQFQSRVGGFGVVHTFKDEDEMQKFVQSRLGQFGIAHKRSDLNDPDYYYRLLKERLGPFAVVHKFESLDQYRDFVNSRLGGLGRATTCLDMLQQGRSAEEINAIYDRAKELGKKDFETDDQYRERMLREKPELWRRLGDGSIVRKTTQEVNDEQRAKLLASGDWVEDPRTGNLLKRDSKAAAALAQDVMGKQSRTLRIRLADGRTAELTVNGFTSVADAIEDALKARGYVRDAAGRWLDDKGNAVMTAEMIADYDRRYTEAMERRAPGFNQFVTRRPRPPVEPPPKTPRQILADLENRIKNSFGYDITNLKIGDRTIDRLRVEAGESVAQAIIRQSGGRYQYDGDGNLVDTRSGDIAMRSSEARELNARYQRRVAESVFGKDFAGLAREVEYLATHGSPEQARRALEIMGNMESRLAGLKGAIADQRLANDRIAAVRASDLSEREKRRQIEALERELAQATEKRKGIERELMDQAHAANTSARDVFARSLSENERRFLATNQRMADLAGELGTVNNALFANPSPADRERLERRRDAIKQELFKLDRENGGRLARMPEHHRVGAVAAAVNLDDLGVARNAALDPREARQRAVGVRFIEENGRRVGIYLDAEGNDIVDPSGRAIKITGAEGDRFQHAIIGGLVRNFRRFVADKEKFDREMGHVDRIGQELGRIATRERALKPGERLSAADASRRRQLEREMETHRREAERLRPNLTNFYQQYAQLDEATQGRVREQAVQHAQESARIQREYDQGLRTITYTDANGVEREWMSERGRAYQAALAEQRQREAAATAAAAVREAGRAAAEAARREAEATETARREAEARRQAELETQRRAAAQRQGRLDARYETENRTYRGLLGDRERAERELAEANDAASRQLARVREGGDASQNDAIVARQRRAQAALADIDRRIESQRGRMLDAGAQAGINDEALAGALDRQRVRIREAEQATLNAAQALQGLQAHRAAIEQQVRAGLLPPGSEQGYRSMEAAARTFLEGRQRDLATQRATEEMMVDNALFGQSSPEFNRRRLAELDQRRAAVGWTGLSTEDRQEHDRRYALQRYHDGVAAARTKAQELSDISARYRRDPRSISSAEYVRLSQGLTDSEINLLLGETQRLQVERNLGTSTDLTTTALQRKMLEDWMTSSDGGLTGTRPLFAVGAADARRGFNFLSRTEVTEADLRSARETLEARRRELAEAEAALRANRTEFNINQRYYSQRLVSLAEERVSMAEREHRGASGQFERIGGSLEQGQGYVDFRQEQVRADMARRAREAEAEQRRRDERLQTAQRSVEEFQREMAERGRHAEERSAEYMRQIASLATDRQNFDRMARGGGIDAERGERQVREIDRRIEELQRARRGHEQATLATQRRDAGELARRRDGLQIEIARTDPFIRDQEERRRFTELANANRELEHQVQARHAGLSPIRTRIDGLEADLRRAQSANDSAAVERINRDLDSARISLGEQEAVHNRRVRALEVDVRQLYDQNRRDGIGPTENYFLERDAQRYGVNLSAAYLADNARLDRHSGSATVVTEAAIRTQIGAPQRSLAGHFAVEMVGENPLATAAVLAATPIGGRRTLEALGFDMSGAGRVALLGDPLWMGKAAVNSVYGAARETVSGVVDLVDTVGEAAAINLGYEDGGIFGTDKINGLNAAIGMVRQHGVRRTVGMMVDHGMREMARGDMDANAARFGGALASMFLAPESTVLGATRTLTGTARALRSLEHGLVTAARWTDEAADAARLAGFLQREAGVLGRWAGRAERGADALAGAFAVTGRTEDLGGLAGRLAAIDNAVYGAVGRAAGGVAERVLPRFLYNPNRLTDLDYATMSSAERALREAAALTERAAASRGDRAARLANEAAGLRDEALGALQGNRRVMGTLEDAVRRNDPILANSVLADAVRAPPATLPAAAAARQGGDAMAMAGRAAGLGGRLVDDVLPPVDPGAAARTARLGESTTPTVRTGREATAPTVRMGPEATAPTVRMGPETTAPTVRTGPEATAPTVRTGPEATAPTARTGREATAPTVRTGPEATAPTVRMAPEATAPTVRAGPEATAPTIRTGPEATAPTVRTGPEATAPTIRTGPEATAPTVRTGPEATAPTIRTGPEATAPTVRTGPEATAPTIRTGPEATAPTVRTGPEATAPTMRAAPGIPDGDATQILARPARTADELEFRSRRTERIPGEVEADFPRASRDSFRPDAAPASATPSAPSASRPARGAPSASRAEDEIRRMARDRAATAERSAQDALASGRPLSDVEASRLRQDITAGNLQEALDARLAEARRLGVPENEIARIIGKPDDYATAPIFLREEALAGIERRILTRQGFEVVDAAATRPLVVTSTRVLAGTAGPDDVALLGREIANASRQGRDFFDDLARRGIMDKHDGFQPIAPRDTVEALRNFARRNGLIPDDVPPGAPRAAASAPSTPSTPPTAGAGRPQAPPAPSAARATGPSSPGGPPPPPPPRAAAAGGAGDFRSAPTERFTPKEIFDQDLVAIRAQREAFPKLDELGGDVRKARERLREMQRTPGTRADDLAAAERNLDLAQARLRTARRVKETEDDLLLRQGIFDRLNADGKAAERLSRADMDWLTGERAVLGAAERDWAENLLRGTSGGWKKDFVDRIGKPGGPSELEMHKLIAHRKQVVDEMLDAAMRAVEAETGKPLKRTAFGSQKLTSDYDLSVEGWGAERAVVDFNRRFRDRFGTEAGHLFDTNVYTDPIYNLISARATRGRADLLPPSQMDDMRQFMYAQMAGRKYMDDAQWARNARLLEEAMGDDAAARAMVRDIVRDVDNANRGFSNRIKDRFDALVADARRRGRTLDEGTTAALRKRAENDVYGDVLERIDAYRSELDFLSSLGPGAANRNSALRQTSKPYDNAVNEIRRLYDKGDIEAADALKAEWQGRMAEQLRNNQGSALYFASEAYQAQGTIEHVVSEIQAAGKAVDAAKLLRRPTAPTPERMGAYLDSMFENRANMFKELNHARDPKAGAFPNPADAAGHAAKYFIRQLDAAHEAGVDLSRALERNVVEATVAANKLRDKPADLARELSRLGFNDPAEFVRGVEKASDDLARAGMGASPLKRLAPEAAAYRREVDELMASVDARSIDPVAEAAARAAGKADMLSGGNGVLASRALPEIPPAPVINPPAVPGASKLAPKTGSPVDDADEVLTALNPPRADRAADAAVPGEPPKPAWARPGPGDDRAGYALTQAPKQHPQVGTRKGPRSDMPQGGEQWVLPNGQVAPVGDFVGKGAFAHVYRLRTPGREKEVLKLYTRPPGSGDDPLMVVADTMQGYELLRKANIPTLDIKHASREGQYIVQEALDPKRDVTFKVSDLVDKKTMTPKKRLSRGQQEAIVGLHRKLIDNGLIWEDGHIENIFFRKTGWWDKWEAGILDTDRIAFVGAGPVNDGVLPHRLGQMVAQLQTVPGVSGGVLPGAHVRSLQAFNLKGFDIPDNRFFMEKMLEYRDRFIWYDRDAKRFKPLILDIDIAEKLYPDLRKHVDMVPGRTDVAGLAPPSGPPSRQPRRRISAAPDYATRRRRMGALLPLAA
ncbi:MAG: hypothetical protein IT564_06055, partial [Rhodospirillales bacterium]|nr:hypothetical protein [Rhodospirillales bacterium]